MAFLSQKLFKDPSLSGFMQLEKMIETMASVKVNDRMQLQR
jgi:hypothetical protein